MDGFAENLGIIILAATNRPDILDPALLRPGRFDRQIFIGIPDIKAREAIFRIHSKNKPLDDEVEPKVLARRTPGFTPADIENMLNEAALLTARRNGLKIRMEEVEEAITKVIAGPEKKSRVISEPERKLTAYHEAGHAIVAASLPNTDPVHQITIVPRGRAGGFTMKQAIDISESTLYPVLRRLQKEGCLRTYDEPFQGRNRRYYAITESGLRQFTAYKEEWTAYKNKLDSLINGGGDSE